MLEIFHFINKLLVNSRNYNKSSTTNLLFLLKFFPSFYPSLSTFSRVFIKRVLFFWYHVRDKIDQLSLPINFTWKILINVECMYKIYREIYFVVREQKYRMFVSNFTYRIMLPKTFVSTIFLSLWRLRSKVLYIRIFKILTTNLACKEKQYMLVLNNSYQYLRRCYPIYHSIV